MILYAVAGCLAAPTLDPTVETPMTPTVTDVQKQFARAHKVQTEQVELSPMSAPAVPGVVLYRATVEERLYSSAVVAGNQVIVDPAKEREAIIRAWGYGPTRTAAANDVATALLLTMDNTELPRLVADAERAAYLTRLGVQGVSVPTETTEDGLPGLRFWYGTGSNPAIETIAVFKADGSVELRAGRSHSGG